MILEGIVTSINADQSVNIAPMGPWVDARFERVELRPFQSSTTLDNLIRTREGVLHVTDDVRLFAEAAVGMIPEVEWMPASKVCGRVIADACRWYELQVTYIDYTQNRAAVQCQVVEAGRGRDFFGFNRAKHAVIEAAILATRVQWLPHQEILAQFDRHQDIVSKTGGRQEQRAMQILTEHVQSFLSRPV